MNQISNHRQFKTGDFHLADVYVVNHDDDNVIEFTPRNTGFFKIMLKQPEREMATAAEETMHLEIGVARADGLGEMHSKTNHKLKVSERHEPVVLDFSVLEFEIDKSLVNQKLLVYFRSVRRTHESRVGGAEFCAELFIEIEFRSFENWHRCDSSKPELMSQRSAIELGSEEAWPLNEQVYTLQIADNVKENPFFYAQDFYLKKDEQAAMFDVEVQVA